MKNKNERTEGKFFPVQYGGYWNIQSAPMYGDPDILDSDKVGESKAEANASFICLAVNSHDQLVEALRKINAAIINFNPVAGTPLSNALMESMQVFATIKEQEGEGG